MMSSEGDECAAPRRVQLKVEVLWGDLHIAQGSLDIGVTHQLHERGQAHTGADHVGGKGVSKPVRISQLDVGGLAMVAK
jgi:hypothetical protein